MCRPLIPPARAKSLAQSSIAWCGQADKPPGLGLRTSKGAVRRGIARLSLATFWEAHVQTSGWGRAGGDARPRYIYNEVSQNRKKWT